MVSKREEYEAQFGREYTERKCSQIISRASMLMVAVVMFFAFSCLFTLSPQNMADAKAQNIPVLSYLANHFASMSGTKSTFATLLEYGASIIARWPSSNRFRPLSRHARGAERSDPALWL